MASRLHLVEQPRQASFSDGYLAGLEHGQKLANASYIWGGIVSGVLASSFVAWVLL